MSEEPTARMNANIVRRVRYYLIFFAIFVLISIWYEEIISLISTALMGEQAKLDYATKIVESTITFVGLIVLLLMNFGRDIDLHNWIDRTFFGVRKKTSEIIDEELINAAASLDSGRVYAMKENKDKIIGLFYHFANEQKVLRGLSFTYWEQYFTNIYIVFFGVITIVSVGLLLWIRGIADYLLLIPVILALAILSIGLRTRYSLVKKIHRLPRTQIEEMKASKKKELLHQIEARFPLNNS